MMNYYTNIVVGNELELGLEMLLTLENINTLNIIGNETELNIVDKLVIGSYGESGNFVPCSLLN